MKLPALKLFFSLLFVLCTFSSCDDEDELRYVLTVSKSIEDGGTISPRKGTYLPGEVVRVTVTPSVEYTFEGWQGDASGNSNPLLITMDANKMITAVFEEKEMQ